MIELISFLSDDDNFILWYIIGQALLFSGLLFYAKISEQIKNIEKDRRSQLSTLFFGGTGMVIFFRLIFGWRIMALITFVITEFIYLIYARSYVVELNKFFDSHFPFLTFDK